MTAASLGAVVADVGEAMRDYMRTTNAHDCKRLVSAVVRLEAFAALTPAAGGMDEIVECARMLDAVAADLRRVVLAAPAPPPADAVRALVAKLEQPRTLSMFMGAHDMALALVQERAEIARELADLSAAPVIEDTHGNAVKVNGVWMDYRDAAAPTPEGAPLTAAMLADALGCFWNAGIGAENVRHDSTARAIVGGIAEGLAAVEVRLRELANPQQEGGR